MSRFQQACLVLIAFCGIVLGFARTSHAQTATVKGKVIVSRHKVKMRPGYMYIVKVKGENFSPNVNMFPDYLRGLYGAYVRNQFEGAFEPKKEVIETVYVQPGLYNLKGGPAFDYTFSVTAINVEKVLLKKDETLAANAPGFKVSQFETKKHHDSFNIPMKANQYYVIDMVLKNKNDNNFDPYLFLQDPRGKILARDDDGAGNYGARILYQAKENGVHRIIATHLSNTRRKTGAYVLTVRTSK